MPVEAVTSAPSALERPLAVLLPLPLDGAFDYRAPQGLCAPPGTFVRVPFGRREALGVVWDDSERPRDSGAPPTLKEIATLIDAPPLPKALRRLIDWVANYTLAPRGAVLRMALSVPQALEPPRPAVLYRSIPVPGSKLTAARRRVLALLADGPPLSAADIAREAAVGPNLVRVMARAGLLEAVERANGLRLPRPDPGPRGLVLSPDQRAAADALAALVAAGSFTVTLLDGVTGSGKTEVYFEAIAAALRAGRQALVLVPEIALTAQWLARFTERFGVEPAVWHSELSPKRRRETWRAVANGQVRVLVGARSALFLPFAELGVIVVDEEHDGAFKQEEGVIYHARDMAVVRARLEDIPIALVSATPSLETVINAETGRYGRLHLLDRHGGAVLPAIEAIDMRKLSLPADRWLSPGLLAALEETLAQGRQALLFLNRRGYAPLTLCRACGHRLQCPQCSAWLVEHKGRRSLLCHHCGCAQAAPEACPGCGALGRFAPCGPGVERLAEEVSAHFPRARCAIAASDTLTGPRSAAELVRRIEAHEIDLLIGTQVLAKGMHFPLLTLVGVVDADLGLSGGDPRAAERTYQLLHQVAGRAGRGIHPGSVLLQTYMPEHPVMAALISGERDAFLAREAEERRAFGWPPFGRLAGVIVAGRDEAAARGYAERLGRSAPKGEGIVVLGPAPAPLALLRGEHRFRLLVKARKGVNLQAHLRAWLARNAPAKGLKLKLDIDPVSFI